jgi:CubicO group peptidase (beta-lactamase class C family)
VDELAKSYKLSADPGTTYYYSNVGYTLVGYMAETAWNRKHPNDRMTYEKLMQERIFKPLGITTAHPGSPGMTMIYNGFILPADPTPVVIGHNMEDNNPAPTVPKNQPVGIGYRYADLPLVLTPTGLWAMTIEDMAKLEQVHMQSKQAPLLDKVRVTLDLLNEIRQPHIKCRTKYTSRPAQRVKNGDPVHGRPVSLDSVVGFRLKRPSVVPPRSEKGFGQIARH